MPAAGKGKSVLSKLLVIDHKHKMVVEVWCRGCSWVEYINRTEEPLDQATFEVFYEALEEEYNYVTQGV